MLAGVLSGSDYGPYERFGTHGIILPATFSGLHKSTVGRWLGSQLALRLDVSEMRAGVTPRIEPLKPRTAAERAQEASIGHEYDAGYLRADARLISTRAGDHVFTWDIIGEVSVDEEQFPDITDDELSDLALAELETQVNEARIGVTLDLRDLHALIAGEKLRVIGIDEAFMNKPWDGPDVAVKLKPAGRKLLSVWLDQMLESGVLQS